MSASPPSTVGAIRAAEVAPPPPVGVCVVRMRWRTHGMKWQFYLCILATIASVFALSLAIPSVLAWVRSMGGGRTEILLATIGTVFVVMAGVIWLWNRYRIWFYSQLVRSLPPDSPAAAFYRGLQIQRRVGGMFTRSARTAWLAQTTERGHVTWLDERLQQWFDGVPRTQNPLEPERIGSFFAQFEVGFGVMACFVAAFNLFAGSWATAAIWGCVGVAMFARLVHQRALFEPVVAGQGWIQRGRIRWTVADSSLIVRMRARNAVVLTFIGPQGTLRLNVSTKKSQGTALRDFWARWTHPHPRPDQQAFDA